MKPPVRVHVIVATLLILAGLFVIVRNVTYTTEERVMKIGDLEATVEERHTVPHWIGICAIVGGLALLAAGQTTGRTARESPHPP